MSGWIETAPGLWRRPLGENEAMIKTIGDKGHQLGKDVWSIAVMASFKACFHESEDHLEMLRNAWKTLRFWHPSIASCAVDGDFLEYSVPSTDRTLDEWVAESFIIIEDDSSPASVIAGLTPRRFATLYYLPDHEAIVLNLSHWRTDGIGALHLLNAYFDAVVDSPQTPSHDLPWGEEVSRLVPSVEDALGLPSQTTPEIEQAAQKYLDTAKHVIGAISIPQSRQEVAPGGTRSAQLRFSPDETKQLETACRRIDVSLVAAVHAAIAATAYSIAPEDAAKHYSSTMRQSIRPYLPAPYNGSAGAAGLYTAGYASKVPSGQTWLENAKHYDAEYGAGATPDLLRSRRQFASVMKQTLKNMPTPNPPPSGLDMSWVPGAEELVRPVYESATASIEVQDISIGVDVISRHMYVFLWTFHSQLAFNLVYNEAFYDEAFAERVLGVVRAHLVENLKC